MKLLVMMYVCVLAMAEAQLAAATSTDDQLAGISANLRRRILRAVAPKQLEIQDALDIRQRSGFMLGPSFQSPVKATFNGAEKTAYSSKNFLISPGQAGEKFQGEWQKNDVIETVLTYHYGAPAKVHMISEDGIYKATVLGNPLHNKDAKFTVFLPKATYSVFESLSNDEATFASYTDIPAWIPADQQEFSATEMAANFPEYSDEFLNIAKPGCHEGCYDPDHHDENKHHNRQWHHDRHDYHH